MYAIIHSRYFEKQLDKIGDNGVVTRILKGICDLERDPLIGEKLLNFQSYRSLRIGDWRVIYEFNGSRVFIIAMGHGHDVYDELKRYNRATT